MNELDNNNRMAPSSVYPISLVVIILLAISSCNEAGAATWSQQNGGWRINEDNGREYWVGPNGRDQKWGNVAPDKQVTWSGNYGWKPDSRFPDIDVEYTRKIPWKDVGKRVGDVARRVGPVAMGYAGIASVIITAGIEVCKQVEGSWCTDDPAAKYDPVFWADANLKAMAGTPESACAAFVEYNRVIIGYETASCGSPSITSDTKYVFPVRYQNANGDFSSGEQSIFRYQSCDGGYTYVSNNNGNYCPGEPSPTKQVSIDPTQMQQLIDAINTDGSADWQGAAQDIHTAAPDLAKSDAPNAETYSGPASVTGTPTTSTTNTTNAQGEAVQTVTTSTPSMSVSYGDQVTINEITNVTNTTTTTTHADGSTTTEQEEKTDIECKNCGKVADPGTPELNYPENKEEDFQQYVNPIMEGGTSGECPAPFQVSALGQDITVSVEPLCKLATDVRPYFLTMMLLVSTMVAFGPSRRG